MTKLFQLRDQTTWFDPAQVEGIDAKYQLVVTMRSGAKHVWYPEPPESGMHNGNWDISSDALESVLMEAERVRWAVENT